MILKHEAISDIITIDFGKIFSKMFKCSTLLELKGYINEVSELYEEYSYKSKIKFEGDLFEIFAEVFINLNSSDNRIGIYDYEPITSDEDNGVDGIGKHTDGKVCTVQVKFRNNITYELVSEDIKQFPFQSVALYGVEYNTNKYMVVFTNCKGLHWHTLNNVLLKRVRVINGELISMLIDNNKAFWEKSNELMYDTVKSFGIEEFLGKFKE